jgi:hypothetical protein
MTKQLQQDSKYNQFDTDGDGVVTDEELARSERMIQIENNDKMQDQQRLDGMGGHVVDHSGRSGPVVAIYSH